MHLVGFIIRIYLDARSSERQNVCVCVCVCILHVYLRVLNST